ncbi:MAG: DedA family protein [Alicyclobacillus herbarius]|uniref:DedA family protein n=1 Tax=Alicyclobacillus herbarius TaxID=122960 RepID=UPI002353951C|nr:DedA family protein [Alicyclobacillus herbarius]MCL6633125.1 DedA family protein [Alicyclobacillus herbarius]
MHFIEHLMQVYGYWGICGALALEYLFVPVPGETTLTAAGVLAQRADGQISLFWLIVAATFGTYAGSMVAYLLGRVLGRPFLLRYGRYVRLTPDKLAQADAIFAKYTVPTLLISRYIAFVRIFVPYIAGINRIRLVIYAPVMLVASLLWTAPFILAGSLIEQMIHAVLSDWQKYLLPAILIVAALAAAYWWFHRWLKRKMDSVTKATGVSREEPPSVGGQS